MFNNNDIFDTKHGGKAMIINYVNSRNIQVQFLDDYKYTKWVKREHIVSGNIKNPYARNVANIGFIGEIEGNATENPLYSKWVDMLGRCYSEKNVNYPFYGEMGVKVCDRWHCFKNFIEDVSSMENYENLITNPTNWVIDKDNSDKKLYSKDTCQIIEQCDNIKLSIKNMIETTRKEVCQYSLDGKLIAIYPSLSEASRITGINRNGIRFVCQGKRNHAGGYSWGYLEGGECN